MFEFFATLSHDRNISPIINEYRMNYDKRVQTLHFFLPTNFQMGIP